VGGFGSGGARVGAGRPRKSAAAHVLAGTTTRAVDPPAPAPLSLVRPTAEPLTSDFAVPDDLTPEERKVWLRLAPHAVAARTLTQATVYGFMTLCRTVALERELARDSERSGKGDHRGLIQRIDAQMARFGLLPLGKPMMAEPEKPVDPFAQFEDRESTH
jgi:hypothetical protein